MATCQETLGRELPRPAHLKVLESGFPSRKTRQIARCTQVLTSGTGNPSHPNQPSTCACSSVRVSHTENVLAAAASVVSDVGDAARNLATLEPFYSALKIKSPSELPLGKIIGIANLEACMATEALDDAELLTPTEKAFGDYRPGRWAWVLSSHTPLAVPVAVQGTLGLFDVLDDAILPHLSDTQGRLPVCVACAVCVCGLRWRRFAAAV